MNIPSAPNPILNNARSGPADMLSAVSAMEGIAPTSASDSAAQRSLIATLAGRTITALVVSRADDGHGIIDVDGLRLTVAAQLPAAGSSVTLRFPGNARNTTGSGATAATGALARLSSALLGETEASGEVDRAGSTLVALGAGAKSLNRFAETPLEPLQLGKMGADIEDTGNWSQELAKALRDSGNFYESHLAAFTRGGYKLEDIRQEPQAMAGRVLEASVPNAQNAAQSPAHAAATAASATLANAANDNGGGGVPDSLRQILREQLHTLETQSMPFSMEAWPGQDADLVIQRDNANGGANSQDGGWKTSLKLNLPELGQVNATLTLSGDRLWLDLSASSDSTGTLDGASGSLAQAMHAAGIQLVRTRVVDQGDGGPGTGGMSGAGASGTGSTGASLISITGATGASGASGSSGAGASNAGHAGASSAQASGPRSSGSGGITATTSAAPRYAAALASAAYAQTRALP